MRIAPVFVLTILATIIFPVVSQGIHGSCREGFIKIAKFNENNKTPLTSCVTSNMLERFSKLGWQAAPLGSNILSIIGEEITTAAKEIIEGTEVVNDKTEDDDANK